MVSCGTGRWALARKKPSTTSAVSRDTVRSTAQPASRVFPWTEAADALRYLEARNHFGKVCLRFD